MKLLTLLLILGNALVFAWIQWGRPAPTPAPAEIHPDRITLVKAAAATAPAAAATTSPAPAASATTAPATGAPPATTVAAGQTPPPGEASPKSVPPANLLCLEWGPIAAKRADDALARLNKFQFGARLGQSDAPPSSGPYWVYFPPLPSRAAADDKLAQLQGLGIKDIAVVPSGQWQNAISLGLYSKLAIANARVASALKKGVTTKIEARGKSSRLFILRNLTADEHDALVKMQANFGGPAFKKTACAPP